MLAPNPSMMTMQHPSMMPMQAAPAPQWHDVKIVRKRKREYAKVMGVPPEEFGISRHARSLRDCGYCFHEVLKRQEVLISEGFDAKQVKALPTYNILTNAEELSRDTVDEHLAAGGDAGINEANRLLKVTEHYLRLDMNKDGKVKLYRIVTGGDQGEVMYRNGEPEIVEEDCLPFAAMTPVIITHRFFGRSIADLVMDIQRIKTALYRAILDNAYLAVNPTTEVPESHANENTLDDLLVRKPGGIVRTKQAGGLAVQQIPFVGSDMMPLIEYVDATREWRTGVSRAGQGLDANALQNQSATAANQLFTAAQARMKLIARIFAETGIKDLFLLLHSVVRKHGGKAETVRLRNNWVEVDPRAWQQRYDMTVNVGLGTGSKAEQLLHLQTIINAQIQGVQAGLVSKQNFYNAAKQLCKLSGFQNSDEFFVDPQKPPDQRNPANMPLPPPPDPKHAEIAAKAQAEQAKVAADAAHQKFKTEADMAFQQFKAEMDKEKEMMKFGLERDLAITKAQLEERVALHKMAMDERKLEMDTAAATHKANLEVQVKTHDASLKEQEAKNKPKPVKKATKSGPDHTPVLVELVKQLSAPKRPVYGKDGKISHIEVVPTK